MNKNTLFVGLLCAMVSWLATADEILSISGWQRDNLEWLMIKDEAKTSLQLTLDPFTFDWWEHHDRVRDQIETGRGMTDVVALDVEMISSLVNQRGFVNLSEQFGAEALAHLFPAYAIAQARDLDGDLYALPFDTGPGAMYYWRDYLDLANVSIDEVTQSWDHFIDYGKKLRQHGIPLVADAENLARAIILTTVEPGNGVYFDAEGNSLATSPRFKRALSIAKKVRSLGLDAGIETWSSEWNQAMNQGTYAVEFSGAWPGGLMERTLAPDAIAQWGVADLPEGAQGNWGGSFLAISAQSRHPEAAWQFIRWTVTSYQHNLERYRTTGAFPALLEAINAPVFDNPMPYFNGQSAGQIWADNVRSITPVKTHAGDKIASEIINSAITMVLDGQDLDLTLERAKELMELQMMIFSI